MQPRSQTWLNVSIGVLLCLVVVNAGVAYHNLEKLRRDAALVVATHETLDALENTVSVMKDAVTSQRGFIITGNPAYLAPYQEALARTAEQLDHLETIASDNPRLRAEIPRLRELVSTKFELLAHGVELTSDGRLEGARQLILANEGQRTMDRIRTLVDAMESDERQLLVERQLADERAYRTAVGGVAVSALAGIVALVGVLALLRRHLNALLRFTTTIHDQREWLRATLSSIGDGVIVADLDGRIQFLNAVAEHLTGWNQAEAAGAPLEEVLRIVNEETRQHVESPSQRALRERRIVGTTDQTILISKDGTEWPIDDSAAPIEAKTGKPSGAVLVFREIRERRHQEAALLEHATALQNANNRMNELLFELRASEELFHTMADSIPQLAWMARPDGHIYWYNKRWYEYTGTSLEQVEGWAWQSVHDPQELPRVLTSWQRALAEGRPWEDTFPLRRHDGAMRWHLTRAVPVHDERGQIIRWFGTNTDISERLQMEQALKEADQRKDEFLATLAHELRNPLSPISNALQLWPVVEDDREEMEKLRSLMDRQIQLMSRLVDDLLDVSRITRGKIRLRRQAVEVATIVSAAVESVQPMIDACGHRLEVELADESLMVDGDVARLTQVLGNLLQNAIKYSGHNGRISIAAYRQCDEAVVRIRDNGIGIPQHMLESIFEMFQQVDQTLDRAQGGLGLGLTLVRRLIELHGGSVKATSEGKDRGSEFVVRLPALNIDAAARPTGTTRAVNRPTSDVPRHRVLVVDDVQASAKTLGMMLEAIGQEVAIAHDGAAAIAHVVANRPDVVFLDIAMPGMNGYDVARRLRENPDLAGITLVALTGYGNEEDRRQAIEAGFHHHLTKPASIDQLTHLLCTLPDQQGRDSGGAAPCDPDQAVSRS